MRIGYLDTSLLVAVAFDEPDVREWLPRLRSMERLYSSTLLESEFLSASEREGVRGSVQHLLSPIRWVHPQRRLTGEADLALACGFLRGADLHHLATALFLFPDPSEVHFLSLDARQAQVAGQLGFLGLGDTTP